jgi:hypothetical protein
MNESRRTERITMANKRLLAMLAVKIKINGGNIMATVGQPLTKPEEGWRRYDDTDSNITYVGTWTTEAYSPLWNGKIHKNATAGDQCQFNFTGQKLRIIGNHYVNKTTSADVVIDGNKVGIINQYGSSLIQPLEFEITSLSNSEHSVQIVNNATGGYGGVFAIDAIDIGETDEIKPYNPMPTPPTPATGSALLRITMIDSSEREYKVSQTEVDGFVNWYNHHVNTDAASYAIMDIVDGGTEYLAFEKIISFKIILLAQ